MHLSLTILAGLTWQSPQSLPLVGLLVLVIAGGAAILYAPQSRRLRVRWRVGLVALRVVALVALAVSMLQPAITRAPTARERGAVVLMVDRSHSMGIRDRRLRNAPFVELADGMGWLPAGVRPRESATARAARKVRAELQELTASQSQLAFATISGLNTAEAADRLAAAQGRFDSVAEPLIRLAPPAGAPVKGTMPTALDNFRNAVERGRTEGRGEAWAQSVGGALDAVERAAGLSQLTSDDELYAKNPDVRRAADEARALSRLGLAEQAVVRPGSGLLAALPADVPLYGFAIGSSTVPLPLRGPGGRPVRRLMLDTESAGTDLTRAIRAALDELRGVPVQAIVLLSDGRQPAPAGTAGANAAAAGTAAGPGDALTTAAAVGVPVFTVAVAPLRAAASDLSLSQVAVPAAAHVGQPFTVRAKVHGTGVAAGRAVDVRCEVGDPPPVVPAVSPMASAVAVPLRAIASQQQWQAQGRQVTLGAGESADVSFEVTVDRPGPARVTLRVPDLTEEITVENNVAERWVKVCPRRARALLLCDAPTWDFRLVRDLLRASGAYDVSTEVLAGGALPRPADDLLAQDVVVMFDVAADSLDARQWSALEQLASARGGGVVVVAGTEHCPAEYGGATLARWVPVGGAAATQPAGLAWRSWEGAEPQYQLSTVAGPLLPPVFRYLPLGSLKAEATPLLVDARTGTAAAARWAMGRGKSLFVGVDETWRWRSASVAPGVNAQDRFWLDAVGECVEAPYAAVTPRLWFDVARASLAPGEAIGVRVRSLADGSGGSPPDGPVTVRVLRDGAVVQSATLVRDATGRASGTLPGLPAGAYVLRAAAGADAVTYPLRVFGQYEEELENPAGDRAALARIADASGGAALSLEDLRDLPARVEAVLREPRAVTVALWDSSYLFVFVVACLTLEWALRKRLGLA